MKVVSMSTALLSAMKAHARETYPDECCGFLVGPMPSAEGDGPRRVTSVMRAANEFNGERRRRFLIRPEELRDIERRLETSGEAVVGFYHSHPDHPARPSQFDQEHAWPWYAYVVLGVTKSDMPAVGAFELESESSTFRPVPLDVAESPKGLPSVVGE